MRDAVVIVGINIARAMKYLKIVKLRSKLLVTLIRPN